MNENGRWTRSGESQQSVRPSSSSPVGSLERKKATTRKPLPRPHETEEEAIIRRFHDAQRMARFRAKKKQAMEKAKALEASKLSEIAIISELKRRNVVFHITNSGTAAAATAGGQNSQERFIDAAARQKNSVTISAVSPVAQGQSKYSQLLSVIQELGKDIKLSYSGSRTSAERLKLGIVQARMLVRDCLLETEVNSRQ